jgi:hypothetical protein
MQTQCQDSDEITNQKLNMTIDGAAFERVQKHSMHMHVQFATHLLRQLVLPAVAIVAHCCY